MKRGLAVAGIWLLLGAAGGAETLRIATFNIENYGLANRVTAMGYRKDYPKPEAAKAAVRTIIREINADVVVMQEMGPRPFLEELQRDLRTEGVVYPHAVLLRAADEVRHVALLSKHPLVAVTQHTDLTFKYFDETIAVKRGLLEVQISTTAGDLTLWALHLKSRYTNRPDDPNSARQRAAEATAIRNRILERTGDPAGARHLIVGDFNDVKTSPALRYMQKRGKTRIAELLPAADSRGETWTYVYRRDEVYNRVDNILVSARLKPAVVEGRAVIHDSVSVLVASDHRPVYVTLDLRGAK
jgi:endonuclease/exonuclease/phosphatase family metal-dependent hydrolase